MFRPHLERRLESIHLEIRKRLEEMGDQWKIDQERQHAKALEKQGREETRQPRKRGPPEPWREAKGRAQDEDAASRDQGRRSGSRRPPKAEGRERAGSSRGNAGRGGQSLGGGGRKSGAGGGPIGRAPLEPRDRRGPAPEDNQPWRPPEEPPWGAGPAPGPSAGRLPIGAHAGPAGGPGAGVYGRAWGSPAGYSNPFATPPPRFDQHYDQRMDLGYGARVSPMYDANHDLRYGRLDPRSGEQRHDTRQDRDYRGHSHRRSERRGRSRHGGGAAAYDPADPVEPPSKARRTGRSRTEPSRG